MIVVKLGGTNGSGKTSIARAILEMGTKHGDPYPQYNEKGTKVMANLVTVDGKQWAILGSYVNVCGGMDTISDKVDRLALIEEYLKRTDIDVLFFEGLITGKTYGAIGEISERPWDTWLYAFMDTPFEECVSRVRRRRREKGNEAPFDAERTMRPTYKSVKAVALRAATAGHAVHHVPYQLTPTKAASELVIAAHTLIGKYTNKVVE